MDDAGFDYFVIRLRRSAAEPGLFAGLVERLGSGEKRAFSTAEHLIALVAGWDSPDGRIQDPGGGSP